MRAFLSLVALAIEIEEGTKRTVSNNLNEHSSGIFLFFTLFLNAEVRHDKVVVNAMTFKTNLNQGNRKQTIC